MLEVGTMIMFTKDSSHKVGSKGVILQVDEEDDDLQYLVTYVDENSNVLSREWCSEEEIEAEEEEE